jgi:hypothetical protein
MRAFTTAPDIRARLDALALERATADREGLLLNALYRDALDWEIAATRSAYVGAAVTEIAVLRGELSGRPQG